MVLGLLMVLLLSSDLTSQPAAQPFLKVAFYVVAAVALLQGYGMAFTGMKRARAQVRAIPFPERRRKPRVRPLYLS